MHDATNRQTGDHVRRTKAKSNGNVSLPSGRKESLIINYAGARVATRALIPGPPRIRIRRLHLSLFRFVSSHSPHHLRRNVLERLINWRFANSIGGNVYLCVDRFQKVLSKWEAVKNGEHACVLIVPHLNNSADTVFETGLKHLRIREQLAFNKLNYLVAWHRSSCRE